MQDRYAFDIGDFSKCGLLRALMAGETARRLGVVWFAHHPIGADAKNNDGRFTDYLHPVASPTKGRAAYDLQGSDPVLFEAFRAMAGAERPRTIAALEAAAPWPTGTRFASEIVPSGAKHHGRSEWFSRALDRIAGSDLVFCDPDNGVATAKMKDKRRSSPKHLLLSEAAELFHRGSSLVLYHHFGRASSHIDQAKDVASRIAQACPTAEKIVGLRFTRSSPRLYVVVFQPAHAEWLGSAAERMRESPWVRNGHFSFVE